MHKMDSKESIAQYRNLSLFKKLGLFRTPRLLYVFRFYKEISFGRHTRCRRCVSVCLWPLTRRFSRGVCDHSQCLISRSGWSILIHPLPPSLARRLVEASGLARSFVRVPYIRIRTSPSHPRAFSLSRASLSSAVALASLSHLVARLSRRATRLVFLTSPLSSPLRRGSVRLHKVISKDRLCISTNWNEEAMRTYMYVYSVHIFSHNGPQLKISNWNNEL